MPTRRVLVAATQVPFQRAGAEWHTQALYRQLREHGFQADVVQVPFQWDPRAEVLRGALAWRLLDLTRVSGIPVDLLIGTRFPSYVARHPNKVAWLFHQFRQAYDLHDAGIDGFPDTKEGRALHEHVIALDTQALRECRRIFTTSENNARRLRKYNGLDAEVLRLPLLDAGTWRTEAFEGFVLSVGRLEGLKRTDLLIRALAHVKGSARAEIVGEGPERERLEALAKDLGLAGRVTFHGYVDDARVKELYARCACVFYAPWDEDYGLVTLEAFHSGKPVVTTDDSGGVLEFVRDGETGLVTRPDPLAVAESLARLLGDEPKARVLGENGRRSIGGVRWENVITSLTAS